MLAINLDIGDIVLKNGGDIDLESLRCQNLFSAI